ncbi:D123-domain-containing protein [Limtongia smithiae]|uniref:D123-domain-containing protein n=1 Tax=Limtongia smithiae TaxID=1125753 RepID=UPI0034D021C4
MRPSVSALPDTPPLSSDDEADNGTTINDLPTSSSSHPTFPPLTCAHLRNCTFSSWSERYNHVTPKATVIKPVGRAFVEYLLSDGIILPPDETRKSNGSGWSSDESDWSDESEHDSDFDDQSFPDGESNKDNNDKKKSSNTTAARDPSITFPHVAIEISRVLSKYGAVCPKLNWSSPRDAAWITTTNTLKCVTAADVYLVLKSSSFVTHDLLHAYDDCVDIPVSSADGEEVNKFPGAPDPEEIELVLRKWIDINPSLEFRCFVAARSVIAISQRSETFFSFLTPLRDHICDHILGFADSVILQTFPDKEFCFDVYISKPETPEARVWLVDINPFAPSTDPLMFTWLELLGLSSEATAAAESSTDPMKTIPELRLASQDDSIRSFSAKPFSAHMMPKEVVDAGCKGGSGMAEFARSWKQFLNKKKRTTTDAGSDVSDADSELSTSDNDDGGIEDI